MPISHGANVEQLASLGNNLKSQIEPINGVIHAVTNALAGTEWVGPARQQFEDQWNTTFKGALSRLNDAFDAAGRDCITLSNEVHRILGAR